MIRSVTMLACVAALAACSQAPKSQLDSFAASNGADAGNQALLFTGSDDGIPGVDKDLNNVQTTLTDPTLGLHFNVKQVPLATVQTVLDESGNTAGSMLAKPDGTLVWYFSSHGAEDGSILANDNTFFFSQAAHAMRQARHEQPLKRLIVILDTCFAGQNATGSQAVNHDTGNSGKSFAKAIVKQAHQANHMYGPNPGLYESLIVLASSAPDEESGDTENGGAGTIAILDSLKKLRADDQAHPDSARATIDALIQEIPHHVEGQTPVAEIDPPTIGKESVFD